MASAARVQLHGGDAARVQLQHEMQHESSCTAEMARLALTCSVDASPPINR